MKRLISTLLMLVPLAFGIAGCKKAHDAGNDSMSAGGGKIEASTPGSGPSGASQ